MGARPPVMPGCRACGGSPTRPIYGPRSLSPPCSGPASPAHRGSVSGLLRTTWGKGRKNGGAVSHAGGRGWVGSPRLLLIESKWCNRAWQWGLDLRYSAVRWWPRARPATEFLHWPWRSVCDCLLSLTWPSEPSEELRSQPAPRPRPQPFPGPSAHLPRGTPQAGLHKG